MRRLAIGIDLGGTNIKGALVGEKWWVCCWAYRAYTPQDRNDKISIRERTLGEYAGILGAVSLVFNFML